MELFPGEKKSIYYTPPIKKKDSPFNKSISASGRLLVRYRNAKASFKRSFGIIHKRKADERLNSSDENSDFDEDAEGITIFFLL